MSSVSVFLKKQTLAEKPAHSCSKTLAAYLAATFPRLVAYNKAALTLHVLTGEAWCSIKARLRPRSLTGVTLKPTLVQDSGMGLMLAYPPRGQETDAPRRQRELWLAATRF